MKPEQIDRINELYRKQKCEGLSAEEAKEQRLLRKQYIDNVKQNLRGQLNNISIEETDGTVTNLGEKHGETDGH